MMAITFRNGIGIVLLPEIATVLLDAELARAAIKRDRNIRRSHLYPFVDATARFACSWLTVLQGSTPFDLPRNPWIITVGDDLHFAWGPDAFPASSLDAAIKAAHHGVLITSGPDPYPYRVAATVAVRDRKNALLIETLPHQREAWKARIETIREGRELPTTYCMPAPTKGAA